jgi:hypothetical protein
MATDIVSNDVSAITPTVWSTMVQQPLYKQLVALKVCNTRLADKLPFGKAIQLPRFADLSAQTYTPGTDLSATDQDWAYDTINVSTKKHATFYVDDVEKLQANVSVAVELAGQAGYQLSNKIDAFAFSKITGAASVGISAVDRGDVFGDGSTGVITASTANIINLFAGVTKVLRTNNVEEMGDWCAVVTPKIASLIEIKGANAGYNVADATLRNGYAGKFMGYEIYISNNLPTGECSALANTALGGPSAAGSATTGAACYFGRKGMIDLVLQRAPAMEVRPCSTKIGSNFITWTVYGAGVTQNNRKRARNVTIKDAT